MAHLTSQFGARRGMVPVVIPVERRLLLSTFVVTTTNDSGAGSLRDAITSANSNTGQDIIEFNIGGAGVHTIKPTTQFPDITGPVVIDGYSQPGAARNTAATSDNAVLKIEIDGSLAASPLKLHFTSASSGSEVRGIVLNHADGILLDTGSHNDTIDGNFLGTDPTGMVASGTMNLVIDAESGVLHEIGGIAPAARNVIANGSSLGVFLNAGNSNHVQGNFIGVAADGATAIGNGGGILLASENHDTIGGNTAESGNVVSGNHAPPTTVSDRSFAVQVTGPQNLIQGNLIGTDATGARAVPNAGTGLILVAPLGRANDVIGNTISGNRDDGMEISAIGTAAGDTAEAITNNFIGTDSSGAHALGNGGSGLVLQGTGNTVNGNVISANALHGVDVHADGQDVLRGNFVGTDSTGGGNLGNGGDGIRIEFALGNVIGGTAAGAANIIAFNGGNGVTVGIQPSQTIKPINNRITANSIFSNGHLGIDLGDDGVTPNTPGGPHTGPNTLQNYPVIGFVRSDPSGTHVTGTLNSTPGHVFNLEFFANATADPSGYGEGMTYLGTIQVNTDSSGNAHFNDAALPVAAGVGSVITATATDASGNTSEFSAGPPAHLSGDVNGDRQVNFADLLTLAQHYGQPGTLSDGDLNDDGQVNFSDLLILAQNYGRMVALKPASTLPQSGDELLLILARNRTLPHSR